MVITDRYDHVIDDKNRLAIPSIIRNALDPEKDGIAFYLVPETRYLQLIPEKLFERLVNVVPTGLMPAPEVAKVRRLIISNASRLEPDGQGRVIIPERFMVDGKIRDSFTRAFIERKVTLVGAVDRLELWNRADYAAHMRELDADRIALQPTIQQMFGQRPSTDLPTALQPPDQKSPPPHDAVSPVAGRDQKIPGHARMIRAMPQGHTGWPLSAPHGSGLGQRTAPAHAMPCRTHGPFGLALRIQSPFASAQEASRRMDGELGVTTADSTHPLLAPPPRPVEKPPPPLPGNGHSPRI